MTKYGRYIVATGKELQVRPSHKHYHDHIVTDESYTFLGAYVNEWYAISAAKGFDLRDRMKLDQEMDSFLRSKNEK